MIIDNLIRSKRRSISLEITPDAKLIVRAPNKISLRYIENLVSKKRKWIESKRMLAYEKYRATCKKFVSGEEFLYLGRAYSLTITDKQNIPLFFQHEFRLSKDHLSNARQLFIKWYKNAALTKIEERLSLYCDMFAFKYNKFNITNAKKRWGSCSVKGSLNFNWRLIMAPLSVIDYVVTHELTHLKEKNHSIDFWGKLKTIFPEYAPAKQWLRKNGHLLII
ncbi:MAG TPA: M48 family peptidase [Candidatus Moranbacteria bacterium]|nr:M48 family peptidase [Candidatus Moranbacteria bacterium]